MEPFHSAVVSTTNIVTGIARKGPSLKNCCGTQIFFFTSPWNSTKITVQGEAKPHEDKENRAGSDRGQGMAKMLEAGR